MYKMVIQISPQPILTYLCMSASCICLPAAAGECACPAHERVDKMAMWPFATSLWILATIVTTGRLLRADLIKWVSNVRPSIHPSIL